MARKAKIPTYSPGRPTWTNLDQLATILEKKTKKFNDPDCLRRAYGILTIMLGEAMRDEDEEVANLLGYSTDECLSEDNHEGELRHDPPPTPLGQFYKDWAANFEWIILSLLKEEESRKNDTECEKADIHRAVWLQYQPDGEFILHSGAKPSHHLKFGKWARSTLRANHGPIVTLDDLKNQLQTQIKKASQ